MSSRSTVAALRLSSALYQTRQLHCRYLFHGSRCILWHQPSKAQACVGDFKRAWARRGVGRQAVELQGWSASLWARGVTGSRGEPPAT